MGFWEERITELQRQQPLPPRAPQIPQAPQSEPEQGFWKQAGEMMQGPEPAQSVAERFGISAIGADIGTITRRPASAEAAYQDGDRDQERRQTALAMKLATEAGAFDDEGSRARAAKDHAAMVAEAVRQGAWTTDEDRTPGRLVNARGVAGATWWDRH